MKFKEQFTKGKWYAVGCWVEHVGGKVADIGQVVFVSEKSGGTFASKAADRPLCATCEGRAVGSGEDGVREINGKPVMFSPLVTP